MNRMRSSDDGRYVVYTICRDGVPVYVGQTANMGTRKESHKRIFGRDVVLTPVAYYTTRSEALKAERDHIGLLLSQGVELRNYIHGDPEQRIRNAEPDVVSVLHAILDHYPAFSAIAKKHNLSVRELLQSAVAKMEREDVTAVTDEEVRTGNFVVPFGERKVIAFEKARSLYRSLSAFLSTNGPQRNKPIRQPKKRGRAVRI